MSPSWLQCSELWHFIQTLWFVLGRSRWKSPRGAYRTAAGGSDKREVNFLSRRCHKGNKQDRMGNSVVVKDLRGRNTRAKTWRVLKKTHTKTARSKYTGKVFQVERAVRVKVWIWGRLLVCVPQAQSARWERAGDETGKKGQFETT